MKTKTLNFKLAGAGPVALGLLLAGCAVTPAEPEEPELVIRAVTGSKIQTEVDKDARIMRTVSPVVIITREDLDEFGMIDLADALRRTHVIFTPGNR